MKSFVETTSTAAITVFLALAFDCTVTSPLPDEDYTYELLTTKEEVNDGNSRLIGKVISSTFDDGTISGHSTIGNYDLEMGSNGGKVGVCAFDGSMKAYGAGVNAKICLDTGVQVKNGNFEAKLLGVGAKIGKDGIEICLIFCIGITW